MSEQISTESVDSGSTQTTGVPPKAYEEVKADMLKYKQQLKNAEAEKEKILEEKRSLETKNLQDQNQYKTLYEKSLEENKVLKGSVLTMKDNFIKNEKLREIESKALASGLKPQGLEILRGIAADTDDVVVEFTSTGRTQVIGADGYIEKLKQKYGDVLFVDGRAPNVNNHLPNGSVETKKWSPTEILALQKKDPAAYDKAMKEYLSSKRS